MKLSTLAPVALVLGTAVASAQGPMIVRAGTPGPWMVDAPPRAAIGVTTTSATTKRDTLGIMISTILPGSPAEKAGLEEGDRIASINGVSLRIASADVDDPEMAGVMSRRLTRELGTVKPGDEITLGVYANDHVKTLKVKAESSSDLYAAPGFGPRAARTSDRPTLGLEVAATGSPRDTLGVFVIRADEDGPAAKAGIVEGSRIASINAVDVRGELPDEDGVVMTRATNVSRFERQVDALHPGDDVALRVLYNGQYRTVTVKAARASEAATRRRSMTIVGDAGPNVAMALANVDGAEVRERVRRAMDTAGMVAGRALADAGAELRVFGPLGPRNSVRW